MSEHTPGPWTTNLESDHGDFTIWGPGPEDAFLANVGTAPQEDRVVAFDVAEANARLIARAPDLLGEIAALRAEVERLTRKRREALDLVLREKARADTALAERDALQQRLADSRSLQEGTATLLGAAEAERDALAERVKTLEKVLTCDCGHGPLMHHKALAKPHPESADTYCECGCEDYTPSRSFAAAALAGKP